MEERHCIECGEETTKHGCRNHWITHNLDTPYLDQLCNNPWSMFASLRKSIGESRWHDWIDSEWENPLDYPDILEKYRDA